MTSKNDCTKIVFLILKIRNVVERFYLLRFLNYIPYFLELVSLICIRPAGINFLLGLQMRVLLEITKFHHIKVCLLRALLELRALFEGGPYMRKYGM